MGHLSWDSLPLRRPASEPAFRERSTGKPASPTLPATLLGFTPLRRFKTGSPDHTGLPVPASVPPMPRFRRATATCSSARPYRVSPRQRPWGFEVFKGFPSTRVARRHRRASPLDLGPLAPRAKLESPHRPAFRGFIPEGVRNRRRLPGPDPFMTFAPPGASPTTLALPLAPGATEVAFRARTLQVPVHLVPKHAASRSPHERTFLDLSSTGLHRSHRNRSCYMPPPRAPEGSGDCWLRGLFCTASPHGVFAL